MTAFQLKLQTIYCGDNLKMLTDIPDKTVDLIYLDPPFNSNRNYEVFWGDMQEKRAFVDRFGDANAYIDYMRPRIQELYRVLKDTGSFYYHCDWHASHYVKIMLDQMFGFNNFQNEIIWQRTNVHNDATKRFPIVNDSIFYYTKSNDFTFNRIYGEYNEEYLKTFYKYSDEKGVYRLDNLAKPDNKGYRYDYKGYKPPANGWRCPIETMEKWDNEGLLNFPKKMEGRISFKRYLDKSKGVIMGNVWTDIQNVQGSAKERLGYPTQKPISLMERIITASSNTGDVVLDPFCGCGTTLVAAVKLNRKWMGIDISPTSCRVMADRLYQLFKLREGTDFTVDDLPKTEAELRMIPAFEFQNWAVIALGQFTRMSGVPNPRKTGDFGIDGTLYPIHLERKKKEGDNLFGEADNDYPVQVKQVDKVGRPDIDEFQTAIRRQGRRLGYFVSFDFSKDAHTEVKRINKLGDNQIILITVKELLDAEKIILKHT